MKFIAHRQNEVITIDADGYEIDLWATEQGIEVKHDLINTKIRYIIPKGINIQEVVAGQVAPIYLENTNLKILPDLLKSQDLKDKILALNIKSTGLGDLLPQVLKDANITNYFLFDGATPDSLALLAKGLRVFTRWSEYEKEPAFYEHAYGVWVDSMIYMQPTIAPIDQFLLDGKEVCLVSPELHGKPYREAWDMIKRLHGNKDIMLCTKFVDQAKEFFNA